MQTLYFHLPVVILTALLSSGCAGAVPAAPPTTALSPTTAKSCVPLSSSERTKQLLANPGVSGPLTAGAIHIVAGGGLMTINDSGTATALGTVSLGLGVVALSAAGIVALGDESASCEQSRDGHAAIDDHRLPSHE